MKRESRALIDVRVVAPASIIASGVDVGLYCATLVFGEISVLPSLSSSLRLTLNVLAAVLLATSIWLVALIATTRASRSSNSVAGWVEGVYAATSLRLGSRWVAGLVGAGLLLAVQPAIEGTVHPWLWLAAATAWVGFVSAAVAGPPRHSPGAPVLQPVDAEGDVERPDWWSRLRGSPDGPVARPLRSFAGAGTAMPATEIPVEGLLVAFGGTEIPPQVVETYGRISDRMRDGVSRVSVVDMPRGGGLIHLVSALTYDTVSSGHRRVLVLCPTSASVGDVHRTIVARLATDVFWSNTSSIRRTGGASGLMLGEVTGFEDLPHVLVATPADLDVLLRQAATTIWKDWLRTLGLVVVLDAHDCVGALGSHVSVMFRRFSASCHRLRIDPHFILECPGGPDRRTFLRNLLGLPIEPDAMIHVANLNERTVEVTDWPVEDSDPDVLTIAIDIVAKAAKQGAAACLVVEGGDVSDADIESARQRLGGELEGDPSSKWDVAQGPDRLSHPIGAYDLAVVVGFASSWARLRHRYGMLGSHRGKPGEPARLVLIPSDPVSWAFVGQGVGEGDDARLNFPPDNQGVVALHLRAAIGSDLWLRSELHRLGARDAVARTLDQWASEGRTTAVGAVDTLVHPAEGSGYYFRPRLDLGSTDEANVTVLADGSSPLLTLDETRARYLAFRGFQILVDGDRFDVSDVIDDGGRISEMRVKPSVSSWSATHALFAATLSTRDGPLGDRTTRGRLWLDRRSIQAEERVLGHITRPQLRMARAPSRTEFGRPRAGLSFQVAALSFAVGPASEVVPVAALHAAGHALRTTGHLFIEYHDDELGVVALEACPWMDGSPALVLYDRARGGLGVTEFFDSQLDIILNRAVAVVESCDCDAGCWRCIDNPRCSLGMSVGDLDKRGALVFLAAAAGGKPWPNEAAPA